MPIYNVGSGAPMGEPASPAAPTTADPPAKSRRRGKPVRRMNLSKAPSDLLNQSSKHSVSSPSSPRMSSDYGKVDILPASSHDLHTATDDDGIDSSSQPRRNLSRSVRSRS